MGSFFLWNNNYLYSLRPLRELFLLCGFISRKARKAKTQKTQRCLIYKITEPNIRV